MLTYQKHRIHSMNSEKKYNKLLLTFLFLLSFHPIFCQSISVDDTTNNPEELVDLLIGNNCIPKSNFSISSSSSVAYFNNNSGNFPINEGVIIRNGRAQYTQGTYTNTNLSSEVSTNGDAQLQAISDENGQTATITDVAFLEFDFVPQANDFNFNFLFASNEYGEFQCSFSDVFAIILTNVNTGETVNLAVVPNSNTNISVKNIRDNQYNNSCNSINSDLFSTYNVNNISNSTLNMRGHTVVMNASANVIPNNLYKIKFAIGDYNDSTYDSAVFIEAGSFDASFDLGEDISICSNEETILDSGYTNITDFSYVWEKNGTVIQGESNPTLSTSDIGNYKLTVTNLNTNCILTDQINISNIQNNSPVNLTQCSSSNNSVFNLTINNLSSLGINNNYDLFYYNSIDNVNNNIPIDETQIENYSSSGETIYLKLRNKNTGNFCSSVLDFELTVSSIEATTPNDIIICGLNNSVNIPSQVQSQILNSLNTADYNIFYYTSLSNANNDSNRISNPENFIITTNSVEIWARLVTINNNDCFDIVRFNINSSDLPEVDSLPNAYECSQYILPTLTNGNYFTGPNGSGNQLFAGDIITEQIRIYIYNENSNGCSNETNFIVAIAEDYSFPLEYCGSFTVPTYPNANFYTETQGPNGIGELIPTGTVLTQDQTIYFYVENDGVFCLENEYSIIINELPSVDTKNDVTTCDSYTLTSLTNGSYYTESNGQGTQLNSGDIITSTQTIYIYNIDTATNCRNENSFEITIIDTNDFQDINTCENFIIPNTSIGNYYTQSGGNGELLNSGETITESQTIYYYASEITTLPNCTENIPISVTINPLPLVDSLDNFLHCESDLPSLPVLTNGNYHTESGGQGTQLNAGDVINTSQTIYIYNSNTFCNAETSFEVEIRSLPLVDNFTDVFSCEPYELPVLNNGEYFTESGGLGTQLNAGDIINTTQTIYIYNQQNGLETCANENVFQVNIFTIEVDELEDVLSCGTYELPTLTAGNYYTQSGGQGIQLNAGDIINTSQTIYIYAEDGGRFRCSDEHSFTVSIFNQPDLGTLDNMEACGSITLPTISIPNVVVEYYTDSDKQNLINPSEYTITDIGIQLIYVHAYPAGNPNCFSEGLFQIRVHPLKDLEIQGGSICVDYETGETTNPFLLESGVNENNYLIEWFLESELVGVGSNYSATEAGTYRVVTTKLNIELPLDCNYNSTEVIVESSSPKFEVEIISGDFSDLYTVEVNEVNNSLGNYSYALDDGDFQDSNIFHNIKPGKYTVTIRDLSATCGNFITEFTALDYPKFFTPNGDGTNDLWNIKDLKNDSSAIIKIYSRMGRLVTVIKPSGLGWNGQNRNGGREQSNDYWFLVEYAKNEEVAQFRGNFSMLRR